MKTKLKTIGEGIAVAFLAMLMFLAGIAIGCVGITIIVFMFS